ncbi:DUF5381 family protein [Neobacillus bataviensis]|uniref:DUF5381 family protein n=1 Tax=Neobacillus bataviensis TaxID=220685 RepID=UPI00138AE7EC
MSLHPYSNFIRTIDNKTIKFNTYNLVTEEVIEHVMDTYVIPQATQELKTNWEKRLRNKSA